MTSLVFVSSSWIEERWREVTSKHHTCIPENQNSDGWLAIDPFRCFYTSTAWMSSTQLGKTVRFVIPEEMVLNGNCCSFPSLPFRNDGDDAIANNGSSAPSNSFSSSSVLPLLLLLPFSSSISSSSPWCIRSGSNSLKDARHSAIGCVFEKHEWANRLHSWSFLLSLSPYPRASNASHLLVHLLMDYDWRAILLLLNSFNSRLTFRIIPNLVPHLHRRPF